MATEEYFNHYFFPPGMPYLALFFALILTYSFPETVATVAENTVVVDGSQLLVSLEGKRSELWLP